MSTNKITASATELMEQAPATMFKYFNELAARFDKMYGKGWSESHSDTIATLALGASIDFGTAVFVRAAQESNVGYALRDLADVMAANQEA